MGINAISILAIDSRGLTTTIYASCAYKDYSYPNSTFNIERVAPTSDYAYMTFNGNWWNNNFGDEDNALSISWYYRQKNTQNWTLGGNLVENTDYTISNNTFYSGTGQSASALTIGGNLLYANAWDFKLVVIDSLKTIEITSTMPQGIPIINWDGTHFNVNGDITQNELPFDNEIYSTTETIVGKWNNETLYRKIVETSYIQYDTYIYVPFDNSVNVKKLSNWFLLRSQGRIDQINSTRTASGIEYNISSSYSDVSKIWCIVEYTKN